MTIGSARAKLVGLGLVLLVAVGGGLASCAPESGPDRAPEPLGSSVVNPLLHAFLTKARAAHHRADLAEQAHDRKKAIEVLESVTKGSLPAITPEVAEVLADTHARVADLKSQEEDFDGALRDLERGLEYAKEPTNFRGHVLLVQGVVEEKHADYLEKHGDPAGAVQARDRAKAALDASIDVEEKVLYGAIGSSGPLPTPPPR